MKQFYIMLTFYSLTLLSVCLLGYYYLVMRPSLSKLEANLEVTSKEVNALSQTLVDIKKATDRLESRSVSLNIKPTVLGASAAPIATANGELAAANQLNLINDEIAQKLSEVSIPPGIGGLSMQVGPTPPTDQALGFVTIDSPLWARVDVYASQSGSSKIIGQLRYGNVYPFLAQESSWYQIRLDLHTTGWVQKALVRESNGL